MIVFSDLIQNQLFGVVKKTKNPVYTKKTKIPTKPIVSSSYDHTF